jgi:Protein of unknown function (DUF3800)
MLRTDLENLSPLEEFILSVCPGDGAGSLMTFYIYFDDSGSHREASTAVAASWISTVEMWKSFERRWDAICAEENLGDFHMTDFANIHSRFSQWPEGEKIRILDRLCDAIDSSVYAGFAYGVIKKDYDELVSPAWKKAHFGEYHYTFALRTCIGRINRWRHLHYRGVPVNYIFDSMGKGKGEIMAAMDAAISQRGELEGYSFQSSSKLRPLKAADIFAWATFQVLQLGISRRPLSRLANHVIQRIGNFTAHHKLTVAKSREGFAQWVEEEKAEYIRRSGKLELQGM